MQKNPRTFLLFTTVRPSATRAHGGAAAMALDGHIGQLGTTNGPTPVYNPSAYASLGYRSGGAHGSGDHGAQPCRPP